MSEWDVVGETQDQPRKRQAPVLSPVAARSQTASGGGWDVVDQTVPPRTPGGTPIAPVAAPKKGIVDRALDAIGEVLMPGRPYDPNTLTGIADQEVSEKGDFSDMALRSFARIPETFGNLVELPVNASDAVITALGGDPKQSVATRGMREVLGYIADAARQPARMADEVGMGQPSVAPAQLVDAINPASEVPILDRLKTVGRFVPETLVSSSGDMAAALGAPVPYILGRTNEVAVNRATNDGRDAPSLTDIGIAAPAATLETLLERFTTMRLLPRGTTLATPGVLPAMGRIAKELGLQGSLGGIEELAPYFAETAGTQQGSTAQGALENFAAGAVSEGVLGGGVQGVKEALGARAPRPQQPAAAQPASGPAEAIAQVLGAVQAEPAPVVQPATEATPADLAPRVPAAPSIPAGMTVDDAREAYRQARTDDERAAAAAVIGALQGQAAPQAQEGVQEPAQAPVVETAASTRPLVAAPATQDATQPQAAPAPAPQEPPAVASRQGVQPSETAAAVAAAMGEANRGVNVHRTVDEVPRDVADRIGLRAAGNENVEGFYDPKTGQVHVIESALDTSRMPATERAIWVAHHERSGHAGLRGLALEAGGGTKAGQVRAFTDLMQRASQNTTVGALTDKIAGEYREQNIEIAPERAADEAIAELAAAVRTGNFGEIESRYGITVPEAQRASIRGYIARLVQSIRKILGGKSDAYSDADVYRLIEDSWRYVKSGRPTVAGQAQQDTIAQRAYHGTPHRGIERFSTKNIGTGEGNQAYGWGLYFAGNKDVAESYRKGLSAVKRAGGREADALMQRAGGDRTKALDEIRSLRRLPVTSFNQRLGARITTDAEKNEKLDAAEAFIRADNNRGQTYQQELPEDNELLTWDDYVYDQPKEVQDAVERAINRIAPDVLDDYFDRLNVDGARDLSGKEVYRLLEKAVMEDAVSNLSEEAMRAAEGGDFQVGASAVLNESGLPGLRYKDGASRGRDGGSYNYVIWDDSRIGAPEALIASRNKGKQDGETNTARKEPADGRASIGRNKDNEADRRPVDQDGESAAEFRKQRLDEEGAKDVTDPEIEAPFSRRALNPYGEDQGEDLDGLPVRIKVGDRGVVEFHGYKPAQDIARKYARKHGNSIPRTYAQVDVDRAERIAAEYEKMKHAPQDPEVRRAYDAMIEETLQQYRDMLKTGLKVEFITGDDPYTNGPRDAILDVVENNHLWVYPTRSGFGTNEEFDPAENPLLAETEFEISGQTALANDIFRAVHDYFGHIANGVGFRADGEENAWREHSAMYSALARRAMTSETRGQNSWLNYGPHGESNRTAKTEDTVFADQKTGLLPEWVSEDGRDDEVIASRSTGGGFSAKKRQKDAVSADAYHYSNTENLKALDPAKAGSGAAGGERRRFGMGTFGKQGGTAARVAFYVREPGADIPDPESAVSSGGGKYLYRTKLDNLYDIESDPRGFVEEAGMNRDYLEELISDAGFDGFLAPPVGGIDVPTAVVFDIGKKKVPVERVEEVVASRVTPAQKNAQRRTLFGHLANAGYTPGGAPPFASLSPLREAVDEFRRKTQDKMLPLLRAQERAAGKNAPGVTSVSLADMRNAYRLETLMHGAIRDLQHGVEHDFILPLQRGLKSAGMSVETFEGWLLARAAGEVNAAVASIKNGMQDGAAGITTADAAGVLAGTTPNPYTGKVMSAAELTTAKRLSAYVDGLRDRTLNHMVDAGQITPKLRAELKKKYPNYIPMRGRDIDEWMQKTTGTGRGLSQAKANIKRRLGRGTGNLPVNILGEMARDAQMANVAKGKAKVNQAFLRFAMANKMPELYEVEPVDLEWKYSEATGEAYLGVKSSAEDLDRSIIVMHNGDPVRIRFEDEQLRDAMLNMGPEDFSGFVKWFGAINRWRSAVLTRYNPAFTPVNIVRDAIFGMTAVTSEKGAKIAAQAAAGYGRAALALGVDAAKRSGDSSVPDAQKSWADWARDASERGMKTGLTMAEDVIDLQRKMQDGATSLMQLAAQGKPFSLAKRSVQAAFTPLLEGIELVNDSFENALRLSTYVALVKNGESKDRAAEYAKNMTINFNRKGQWSNVLNSLYLFYNASIQGTHATLRVMRNPKVSAFLVGLAGLQAVMAASMMDDWDLDGVTTWDTIPDYVKRTSMVIPLHVLTGRKGDYFAIPMPFGFNLFTYGGGRITQRSMLGSRETDTNVVADMLKSTSDAFIPIDIASGYGSLFGDQIGFAMQLASNKDDQGFPIANDQDFEKYDVPKAMTGRADTPRVYQTVAQLLAKLGGGDLKNRIPPIGHLDVAPEQIEAVTNYVFGGLANLTNKTMRWWEQIDAKNLETGMDVIAATPIASRFIGTGNESRAIADRYYRERGAFERKKDVIQDRVRAGEDPQAVIEEMAASDPTLAGLTPERRKRTTRKDGKVNRRGEYMKTAAGGVEFGARDATTPDVLRDTEKQVKGLGKMIRTLQAGGSSNADVVSMVAGFGIKPEEINLTSGYDRKADAPNAVRQRAIRLLQQKRTEQQRRLLKITTFERINGSVDGKE